MFGYSASSEYSTSKVYMDQYGIIYMAGYSTSWCNTANSMIIFKNNFEMDLWETHTNGDIYDPWTY